DLIGGQVQVVFNPLPSAIELIMAGKLRALAVSSASRWPTLPDVPTLNEFVPGYEASGWNGVGVPKNTPIEIVGKLNKETNAGFANSDIKARLADLGATAVVNTPDKFKTFVAGEIEKWGKVIRWPARPSPGATPPWATPARGSSALGPQRGGARPRCP